MIDIGIKIKSLRQANGYSQSQLASKIGVTKATISAYENEIRYPSYDALIQLTKVFDVTSDFLLGIEKKNNIELSGLTDNEKIAIVNLINAMKIKNVKISP